MNRLALACCLFVSLAAGCGDGTTAVGGPDGGASPDLTGGPFALEPGEVAEVPVQGGVAGVRLATPAGSERFLLVLGSTALDTSGEVFDYTLTTDATVAASAAPAKVTGCAIDGSAWSKVMLPADNPPSGPAPKVGDMRTLTIGVNGGTQKITAQVAAVGKSAVVWVDQNAVLDAKVIADFLTDFDDLILPRERTLFGMESDSDGDGRIGLVFSPLTNKTAVAFFTGCDLAPLSGCYKGNGGEFLYLTPPKDIAPPYNTPAAIREILAHELGHLIHFNRKVLRNRLGAWDDSGYMIEGFGGFTQDASGYQAGNLYVAMAGLDGIDEFTLGDVLVDNTPYDRSRDGVLRGGGYLFVRWLYDRGGGDLAAADGSLENKGGPAFLRALLDDRASVASALGTVGKAKAEDVAMDFFTTLGASNREEQGAAQARNPCFRYLPVVDDPKTAKPRGANLFLKFHGTMQMAGPMVQSSAAPDGQLRAGGVEYVELDAKGAELDVLVNVKGDAGARVRVLRLQ